ncbi:hypothetical protein [uncultured Tateyamaria sp.]|nr:hypothetical protein [uncultured Tateyamaria sp.]
MTKTATSKIARGAGVVALAVRGSATIIYDAIPLRMADPNSAAVIPVR